MGSRYDKFSLYAFTDSSKDAYGVVIYIKNEISGKVTYMMSRTKLLNKNSCKRTMPTLELQALVFGIETVANLVEDLSGNKVVVPINIGSKYIFTDSMVCVQWLRSYSINFEKQSSLSVFTRNKLKRIDELCQYNKLWISHIQGKSNPADYLTRCTSYKIISKSEFYSGPGFIKNGSPINFDCSVQMPNNNCKRTDQICENELFVACNDNDNSNINKPNTENSMNHIIPLDRYSNFDFHLKVFSFILKFINKLKSKVSCKGRYNYNLLKEEEISKVALFNTIKVEQIKYFSDIFNYLNSKDLRLKNIPKLMNKINIFIDEFGILRVKSKFGNYMNNPILLPKESLLTKSLIRNIHENAGHGGIYRVLKDIRDSFWINHCFSLVSKIVKNCIICKRLNAHPIKINQNDYRPIRKNPPKRPFSAVYLDYIGPFETKLEGRLTKVWLLAVTCLFSRALSLTICRDATTAEFLKAIQIHCYEHGLFQSCISDLGSQIQAGSNILKTFLSDFETKKFLNFYGIHEFDIQHYPKGNSSLGSVIESLVKQVKYLIVKSIKRNVLNYFDFELLVRKTVSLINKRPISLREQLRSVDPNEFPVCITPERILKGYETIPIGIIPNLEPIDADLDYNQNNLNFEVSKLRKVRENLIDIYHAEFLYNLENQATDKPDRYKPVKHTKLKPGDIVLLVEKHLKRYCYPMGRVLEVVTNDLDETTAAKVLKGDTREVVYRHSTSLILLIDSCSFSHPTEGITPEMKTISKKSTNKNNSENSTKPRSTRKAAMKCLIKMKNMAMADDI